MIKIFTDSDCDLPDDIIKKYGIGIVPFGISYGDDTYYQGYYELSGAEFFSKLRSSDAFPRTSQPTLIDYEERFRPFLEQGDDIFCLTITGKFSGSIQSGLMAVESLSAEFPDRKIVVTDSRRCTVIHGYLTYQACLMRDDGLEFDEIVRRVSDLMDSYSLYVAPDNLEYLRKGGRLGKAGALAGSLLNIKPVIKFCDGELQAHSKVRGKKKAISEMAALLAKDIDGRFDEYQAISFCCDENDASAAVAEEMRKNGFKNEILPWHIGPVVGAHIGPTAFGCAYSKKYIK